MSARPPADARRLLDVAYRFLDEPSALVDPPDELILVSCEVGSPGFVEFLGSLNPLEVLRKFVADRHVRRQDREYREREEQRRLQLENMLLENEVLRERIGLLREFASEAEVVPLMRAFVIEPLGTLGRDVDAGLVLPAGTLVARTGDAAHSDDDGPTGRVGPAKKAGARRRAQRG